MSETTTANAPEAPAPDLTTDEIVKNFLANGRTMRDFTNLTPESMEVIYMLAFNLYNAAKFENAEKIFHLLSNLDHFERKYWKGLGACRQALQKYDEALLAYGYLGMMRPEDPDPAYQAAKCFVAVGKMAEAETALRGALFGSVNKPEYAEIHARATTLLEVVENNRKAKSAATSS